MRNKATMYFAINCLYIVFAASLIGCGSGRPETVYVGGTVTIDGKAPTKPGMIYFAPTEPAEGFPRRPGRATFDTDGRFCATTFVDGDGLIPGHYRVGIDCWQTPPLAEGPPAVSLVPDAYREPGSSGMELVVEPGVRSVTADYNVPTTPH